MYARVLKEDATMTARETMKRRARFWRWLRRFEAKHPGMTLAGMLGCAQDAGFLTREERSALLRNVGAA